MLEHLIEQLSHGEPAVRFEAAQQLGQSRDSRAVEALVAALQDENSKVQYAAFSGLIKLADPRAASPIVDLLLKDPDSRVWDLLKLNIGSRLRTGLLDLIQSGDTALANRLTSALESQTLDEQQQAFVVRMLGRTSDSRSVEALIDLLREETPTVQGAAAEALGYIGDQRAVAPLLLFLRDENHTLREVSVEALGRLGDERAVQPVLEALHDDNEWVRRAACVALGQLGDRSAVEHLANALNDETGMVQDAAFEAIKQLSDDNYSVVI